MSRGTRNFMIGSALVVVLGVGTGLVAYYNGDLAIMQSKVGPDDLAYVPADAKALAFARVRDIMNSEFRQKLRQVLPTGDGKNELFNETGIDVEHDIDSVLGASFDQQSSSHGLALIRGRFDEGRIEQLIREHGGTISDYNGKRIMTFAPGPQGGCLVFPETGLALIGDQDAVKRALDAHATKQNITGNAEVMKHVASVDSFENTAWVIGDFDAIASHANLSADIKSRIPPVDWFAASVHVDGGLSGHLRADARDDQAAADLRAVVNGALAAARLVGGKDPRVGALVSSLQMSGEGKQVDLAFTVPAELIDVLNGVAAMKNLPEHHEQTPKK